MMVGRSVVDASCGRGIYPWRRGNGRDGGMGAYNRTGPVAVYTGEVGLSIGIIMIGIGVLSKSAKRRTFDTVIHYISINFLIFNN